MCLDTNSHHFSPQLRNIQWNQGRWARLPEERWHAKRGSSYARKLFIYRTRWTTHRSSLHRWRKWIQSRRLIEKISSVVVSFVTKCFFFLLFTRRSSSNTSTSSCPIATPSSSNPTIQQLQEISNLIIDDLPSRCHLSMLVIFLLYFQQLWTYLTNKTIEFLTKRKMRFPRNSFFDWSCVSPTMQVHLPRYLPWYLLGIKQRCEKSVIWPSFQFG